jgi:7-cyano-7-deazaguanine synthase in queuosine biosynthesis
MIDVCNYGKRIAVLYSGGADSTLLYYLTIKSIISNHPEKTLDLLIVDRYNKPLEKAQTLYNRLKIRLNDNISTLKTITLPKDIPGNLQITKVIELSKWNYDTILWGINQYPDDMTIRPKVEYTVDFSKFSDHPLIKLPFAGMDKSSIIKRFLDLGLEDILNSTHSCGNPAEIPCGKCFNCRERIWAYERLGLTPNLGI